MDIKPARVSWLEADRNIKLKGSQFSEAFRLNFVV